MSRDVIELALRRYYRRDADPQASAAQALARYDAEQLRAEAANLRKVERENTPECALGIHQGLLKAALILDERADLATEKSSRTAADATPGLTARQARLLDAIRTHGGEWTTRRVLGLFALTDPGVVQRGTARRDLATLHRAGHLVLVDDPDKRHYALSTRKDGRS